MPKREGVLPIPSLTFIFNHGSVSCGIGTPRRAAKRKRHTQKCSLCHRVGHRRPKCPDLIATAAIAVEPTVQP